MVNVSQSVKLSRRIFTHLFPMWSVGYPVRLCLKSAISRKGLVIIWGFQVIPRKGERELFFILFFYVLPVSLCSA